MSSGGYRDDGTWVWNDDLELCQVSDISDEPECRRIGRARVVIMETSEEYSQLSDAMRRRLDVAELAVAKMHDWADLLAERGPTHYLLAREMCLILGWGPPRRPNG